MEPKILICDKAFMPREWADHQTGVCYHARGKVLWELGSLIRTFRGGKNENGEQSLVDVYSILGVSGPIFDKTWYERPSVYSERKILYGRDLHTCAYCGEQYLPHQLTIDHILPQSRGGKSTWMNTVASCKPCNVRKGNKTPEEAKMHLLFVPYVPSMFEKMILKERNILADQMEFLIHKIPKHSRIHQRKS